MVNHRIRIAPIRMSRKIRTIALWLGNDVRLRLGQESDTEQGRKQHGDEP